MMNERMYELINQCFIGTTDGKLSELNTVANVEKFAGLIVRECISQVEKDHFGGRESWDRSINNSVNNIKTHFGVE